MYDKMPTYVPHVLPFLKEREGYMTKQGAQDGHVRYTKVQMKMRLFSGC